jgi:hypothetical protein
VMLKEICAYLQSQGAGTLETNLFWGLMPDQPDNCIALFEYAGSPPDLHWNGEYPGLQVRVRDTSYAAARTKIGEIMTALHGLYEQTLGSGDGDEAGNGNGNGDEGNGNGNGNGDEGNGNGNGDPVDPMPAPVTGTRYLLIKARGSPEVLKRDASNRIEFFINFEIIKERD